MRKLLSLYRDDRAAAAIEMAIAVPVLVTFLWGIFQVGVAFQANAGMQHALGEGARLATICKNPTADGVCSVATDTEIENKIKEKAFGTGIGEFEDPTVTVPDEDDCTRCRDLSVTFSMPTDFLLFKGPNISLTRTKRVYVAEPAPEPEEEEV